MIIKNIKITLAIFFFFPHFRNTNSCLAIIEIKPRYCECMMLKESVGMLADQFSDAFDSSKRWVTGSLDEDLGELCCHNLDLPLGYPLPLFLESPLPLSHPSLSVTPPPQSPLPLSHPLCSHRPVDGDGGEV